MRVAVVLEHRFAQTPDGQVWTDGAGVYSFWTRYLAAFEEVCVVARVKPVDAAQTGWLRADGPGVTLAPLPYYLGPGEFLRKTLAVRRAIRQAVGPEDAVILRVPSPLGGLLVPTLRRHRQPFAVEVVGDPYDVFAPGAVRHPLRPWFRAVFSRALRAQCRHACAAAYVTAQTLQRRYPPGPGTHCVHYSDVQIEGFIAEHPRGEAACGRFGTRQDATSTPCQLVLVGSLEQWYKGPDVLMDAVAQCTRNGLDLRLSVVGDGKHRAELELRAAKLGLGDRVCFRGRLPAGDSIRQELDRADLFVLPSRTEGLPRAMIEAMGRGLPCIGSAVGGIPELLPPEDMVPPGDATALAEKIREVVADRQRMARMSARNLQAAQDYREDVLRSRRTAFYQYVRQATAERRAASDAPKSRTRSKEPSHHNLTMFWSAGVSPATENAGGTPATGNAGGTPALRGETSSSCFDATPKGTASSNGSASGRGPKAVFLVTSSLSVEFVCGQAVYLRGRGFEVHLVSSPGERLQRAQEEDGILTHELPMAREISLGKDSVALYRLARLFWRLRPELVVAATPKAGLLGMLAARLAGVPVRIYQQYGLRLETTGGLKRRVLGLAERAASACASRVICVSPSLRELYLQMKLAPPRKVVVLGAGSSHGVDAERYQATAELRQQAATIRSDHGIPADAPVVGFVGRLTRDKGIGNLLQAFELVRASVPAARLLLRGDFEPGDPLPAETVRQILLHPRISLAGFGDHMEAYYQVMDVLAFPSYREGLPNVPLEAAAAGRPVVGFAATGTIDAVVDGVTGTLVPPGDAAAMAEGIVRYLQDPELRHRHGAAARHRVVRDFRPEAVWEALHQQYLSLIHPARAPVRLRKGCG